MQHHLVKCTDEERIQESAVENRQAHNATDEFEVVEMLWVDTRVRIDLEGIVVVRRVLEQAVERIEHLVREEEEELSGQSTIIESVFAVELDHQSLLEIRRRLSHDLGIRVLEDVRAADLDMALSGENAERWLRSKVDQLAPEISLVLWHVLIERRWKTWIIPSRSLRVVVDKVHSSSVRKTHFPSRWQWSEL